MRKESYDQLVKEAIERINNLPEDKLNQDIKDIKDALERVLKETDDAKLEKYYATIDEFASVNPGRGLEYLNGYYLLTHGL